MGPNQSIEITKGILQRQRRRLLMMFAVAFGWIVFLTAVMPWPQLTREEVHSELGKLYEPFILIIGMSWILVRFPRLAFPREFLPKSRD
jgi:hypothetical protein